MTQVTQFPVNSQALPDYVTRLLGLPRIPPGSVARIVMVHADHCQRTQGEACTCVPDMTLQREDGHQMDVGAAGHAGETVKAS